MSEENKIDFDFNLNGLISVKALDGTSPNDLREVAWDNLVDALKTNSFDMEFIGTFDSATQRHESADDYLKRTRRTSDD